MTYNIMLMNIHVFQIKIEKLKFNYIESNKISFKIENNSMMNVFLTREKLKKSITFKELTNY
jgi:hypothetical protein